MILIFYFPTSFNVS
uniref:Uncharacterized protein n=1 Tax=Anguilla anguilla TaxID=7936 RepID=A0A0E9UF28_ANGAN